jgi:hypothetical protein
LSINFRVASHGRRNISDGRDRVLGVGIDAEGVYVDELAFRYPPKKPKSLRISASSGESVGNLGDQRWVE